MPELPDSQKKISKEYSGHLAYFRKPHYLRRLKFLCFTGALTAIVVGMFTYEKWASQKAFSPGPLSQNHAHLADHCESCHSGSDKGLGAGFVLENLGNLSSLSSLEAMDAACIKCHPGTELHAPQMQLIGLRNPAKGSLVHASACSTCHREHAGPQRMALPSDRSCTDCHGDAQKLEASLASPLKSSPASQGSAKQSNPNAIDLGEGLLLFLPPIREEAVLPAFESFADGHPKFSYEQANAVDPSNIKFNHARHFRSDIPQTSGGKLECTSCHQPEAHGAFYQPVRYEKHCQECHSLQILQSLPNLHIPHGDSEKVRLFLAGLQSSVESTVKASGVTDALAVSSRVKEEMESLRKRGLYSMDDLQKRVFLQGDPQDTDSERLMRSGRPKFLTECAKCHTVKDGASGMGPEVDAPVVASRWLAKGEFNHLPHKQSACKDCHGAAEKSKLTSDILLPTQQSCAECHQPPKGEKGGVKFSCQSCHHFHSTVAPQALEASAKVPPQSSVPSILSK